MNTYLLSLGSNNNRTENMAKCRSLLSELYDNILFSEMLETEPFGEIFLSKFYNQLALIESDKPKEEIIFQLKHIEVEIGRQVIDKSKGIVKIDLDLLVVNNCVVKKEDFKRPYLNVLLTDFSYCFDIIE